LNQSDLCEKLMNTPTLQPLKVLHVGVGNRGLWPLQSCPATGLFQSVALCDTSREFLAQAREKTGLPESACFTDLNQALESGLADCAILCTPTETHVPLAKKAMQAGLHVLTEKGMAPNWADALTMIAFAKQRAECFAVAQNFRYKTLEHTLSRLLKDEASPFYPGPVFHVDYIHHRVRPLPRTLNYPFASVWDMSCHHFDNLLYWFGPVADLYARAYAAPWSAYPYPNNTDVLLHFASGVRATYSHTHDAAHPSQRIEIHGQRGMLRAVGDNISFGLHPRKNFGWTDLQDVPLDEAPGMEALLVDFHRYITEGTEPGISGFQNLETMALCEMTVRSCTESRSIQRKEL
jgi:predicted dehydrogenase